MTGPRQVAALWFAWTIQAQAADAGRESLPPSAPSSKPRVPSRKPGAPSSEPRAPGKKPGVPELRVCAPGWASHASIAPRALAHSRPGVGSKAKRQPNSLIGRFRRVRREAGL